jgi:lipopolysaccharide biosynthesis glycosyltransferase
MSNVAVRNLWFSLFTSDTIVGIDNDTIMETNIPKLSNILLNNTTQHNSNLLISWD